MIFAGVMCINKCSGRREGPWSEVSNSAELAGWKAACQVGQAAVAGAASSLKVIASEGDPGTSGGKLRTDGKVKTKPFQAA